MAAMKGLRLRAKIDRRRLRRHRRIPGLEGLEERVVLSPTIYTVDLATDNGPTAAGSGFGAAGDLRYVIGQANVDPNPDGSIIEFDRTVFATARTITLSSTLGTLDLAETAGPEVIDGSAVGVAVSGVRAVGVFQVDAGVTATMSGLTITGGAASSGAGVMNAGILSIWSCTIRDNTATGQSIRDPGGSYHGRPGLGGGIDNSGTLSVADSTFSGNSASGGFGDSPLFDDAKGAGGGIENSGTLTITGSTFSGNSATGGYNYVTDGAPGLGGGIDNTGAVSITDSTFGGNLAKGAMAGGPPLIYTAGLGAGGAILNAGTLSITDSTFSANSAASGIGPHGLLDSPGLGGGIDSTGTLSIASSTFSGNSTTGDGSRGGGIQNSGAASITNSTFSGNSVNGGNVYQGRALGGAIDDSGPLSVTDGTIAGNMVVASSGQANGGGISYALSAGTAVSSIGTIYDNPQGGNVSNTSTGSGGGAFQSLGHNLFSDTPAIALEPTDLTNSDPKLGPLAQNGGPTMTLALLPGSPAIGAGTAVSGITTDQRGLGRPPTDPDIGAYQTQGPFQVVVAAVEWGTAGMSSLQTAPDGLRLMPAGRKRDLPWLGIDRIVVSFNQPAALTASEVTLSSARGIKYGPVTITGSSTMDIITLSRPIMKSDRVTVVIAGLGIVTYTRRLDVLPGDFNDSGVVNCTDVRGVRREMRGVTPMTVFGDVLGDGRVDRRDYKAERKLVGTRLPRITIRRRPASARQGSGSLKECIAPTRAAAMFDHEAMTPTAPSRRSLAGPIRVDHAAGR